MIAKTIITEFQSTFPRGERRIHTVHNPVRAIFQSTFPRGERPSTAFFFSSRMVFQSTFPRGERLKGDLELADNNPFQSTFPRGERQQILTIFHLYIRISNPNLHFNITPFHIFYLIHFFWACFFQLFMVRIFWGFSVYFWFALYRNNT